MFIIENRRVLRLSYACYIGVLIYWVFNQHFIFPDVSMVPICTIGTVRVKQLNLDQAKSRQISVHHLLSTQIDCKLEEEQIKEYKENSFNHQNWNIAFADLGN